MKREIISKPGKILIQILIAICALAFIIIRPYRVILVNGSSMMPNYHNKQIVLAVRYFDINKGDVVVVRDPDTNGRLIKRIVAVEGDYYWQYIWIDEKKNSNELYWFGADAEAQAKKFQAQNNNPNDKLSNHQIKVNNVFILGDNIKNSIDSREFGPMHVNSILYKVM